MKFEGKGNKDNPKPHFYYNPRITFDELKNTSDNILILTSCLGSPIWQYYKSNQKEKLSEWIEFVKEKMIEGFKTTSDKNKHKLMNEYYSYFTASDAIKDSIKQDFDLYFGSQNIL